MYFDGMKKLLRPNIMKKMSEGEKVLVVFLRNWLNIKVLSIIKMIDYCIGNGHEGR